MALTTKSNDTDEFSDDEDSKMKSYNTRHFKKFMKNANVKGFDKDQKQSSSSQFKSQDKGKKDARDDSQYTVPIKDWSSIRPSTFKIASLMASGEVFGLAVPILASIYRGLNIIFNNPVPSKSSNGFAVHYVYAWIAHFFKSHRVVNDELGKAYDDKIFWSKL